MQEIQEALQLAQQERTRAYLWQTAIFAGVIVLIAAVLNWLLGWIKHHFFQAASQRLTPNAEAGSDFRPLRGLDISSLAIVASALGVGIGFAASFNVAFAQNMRSQRLAIIVWR